jgi:hypothetical protein
MPLDTGGIFYFMLYNIRCILTDANIIRAMQVVFLAISIFGKNNFSRMVSNVV